MYKKYFKRVLDIVLALLAFIMLFPFNLLIVSFLLIYYRGNPLFCQERPGKNAEIFKIFKYRTMNNWYDYRGEILPDHKRITPIGKFMRIYSIDEIPQIINVLRGDMSFIGPRPLLPEDLLHASNYQFRRYSVLPGITGWAQVNGRNKLDANEKYKYDICYVENISFSLDFKILLRTIKKVITSEGI